MSFCIDYINNNYSLFVRYGLIVPKKRFDGVMKMVNVFGDDSDSENEMKNKPTQVSINILV